MKIAVLAGGRSSEHPVSLESAKSVLEGLESAGHECVPVVIEGDGTWRLRDPRAGAGDGTQRAIEVVPGRGLLECLDLPYVGAGVLASALCMDKAAFKRLMAEAGVPQVRYEAVLEPDWRSNRERVLDRARAIGLPCFVKPARLGSSFGISKVVADDELPSALDLAFEHDPSALIEAAASGVEVECSVIGNSDPIASEPGEVIAQADWYDYESKYTSGGMELIVPARISPSQRERVRRLAVEAFVRSSCSGLARVDFFITDEGQVLVNELNTIPGFTSTSVFARLFDASGIGYEDLLGRLLGYAIERHETERRYRF